MIEGEDASQSGDVMGEWQGLLREVQKGVKRQNETMKEELKKSNTRIENEIANVKEEIVEMKEMLEKIVKATNNSAE